jgi:putative flavoprotein involved in K+ transport
VATLLQDYAAGFGAPVVHGADVISVRPADAGYRVDTTAGTWQAGAVVVATGWCDAPSVPALAARLPRHVAQLTAATFTRPEQLPLGGVLVVGASASGVQLADEISGSHRRVLLAVGAHTRLPRDYRGLDVLWWLDAMGVLGGRLPASARPRPDEPSMQLTGRDEGGNVDLASLQDRGVRLAGRLTGVDGARVRFADDLPSTTAAADAKLRRLLRRIDAYATAVGLADELDPVEQVRPAWRGTGAPTDVDLDRAGIGSVIWATGYRRAYPWLHVPVFGPSGDIAHAAGTTTAPGLHVVGMMNQTRHTSTFIDGVGLDAALVVGRILRDLGVSRAAALTPLGRRA